MGAFECGILRLARVCALCKVRISVDYSISNNLRMMCTQMDFCLLNLLGWSMLSSTAFCASLHSLPRGIQEVLLVIRAVSLTISWTCNLHLSNEHLNRSGWRQ